MWSNASVAAGTATALIDFAERRGAERSRLFLDAQLATNALVDPEARVALAAYVALFDSAARQLEDPAFALHFGETVPLDEISILGLLGPTMRSIEDGRQQMNRYARLVVDEGTGASGDWVSLDRIGGELRLTFTSPLYRAFPCLAESGIARGVCGGRAMLADLVRRGVAPALPFPKAIHFAHPEPPYRSAYERVLGVPLSFGGGVNALVIDEGLLAMTRMDKNAYATSVVTRHADRLLLDLERRGTVRGRVEGILATLLPDGRSGITDVAKALGVSRQTLFRRLKSEGTTFAAVLEEFRHTAARQYLVVEGLSVHETAARLGFSDATAFSRAFRRWSGISPRSAARARAEDRRARAV